MCEGCMRDALRPVFIMKAEYDYSLVLLSIAVAMIAAFVSVDLASRVRMAPAGKKLEWLMAGSMVMGIGIWTMHFIGMLALHLPMRLGYELGTTLISIIPAIVAAGCVLHLIQRHTLSLRHILLGGAVMGAGIGAMHYIGMHAMVMSPPIRYEPGLFSFSIVFAFAGSALTIFLAHRAYAATNDASRARRELASAVVGGLAIAGMHYLGMAAAVIAPDSFCISGFQGPSLPHRYHPWLVAMSVAISIMASYTALDVASRVRAAAGRMRTFWLIGGGFAMGLGIWSMHFIGMVAMHSETPVTYDLRITMFSVLPAFAASGFALYMIQRGEMSPRTLGLSGLLMGCGIGAMHYIGMAAVQIEPPIRYDPTFFALSLLVAVAASVSALWIGFQNHAGGSTREVALRKLGSALVMGLAIAGMHYSGMSATHLLPASGGDLEPIRGLDPTYIAVLVGIATSMVLLLTYVVAFYDARLAVVRARVAAQLSEANHSLQARATALAEQMTAEIAAGAARDRLLGSIVEQSREAIITTDNNYVIQSWNAAAEAMFGYSNQEAIGVKTRDLYLRGTGARIDELVNHLPKGDDVFHTAGALVTKDGLQRHVSSSMAPRFDNDGQRVGMIAMVRDVTAEVHAEMALRAEKQRAEITLASIADAVIAVRADATIEYLNPAAENLLDRRQKDVAGAAFARVVTLRDEYTRDAIDDVVARCFLSATVTPLPAGAVVISASGGETAVEGAAAPILAGNVASGAVVVLSDVTERRRMARALQWQATHDALTQLENRRAFEGRVEAARLAARENGTSHALLYLDLDQFKIINDVNGHAAGDQMLCAIAVQVQKFIRNIDFVARLGGDEFGVLLSRCTRPEAVAIAENLCVQISQFRLVAHERTFQSTVSIGLVPIDAASESVSQLLMAADTACYLAKDGGRNRVWVEQPTGTETALRRREMQWVVELDRAIEQGRLQTYCQPVFPLQGTIDRAAHLEVLLRMVDTSGTLIMPNAFIPAAERYGVMPRIDRWVIEHVLQSCKRYCQRTPSGPEVMLAMNVSATSLNDETFIDFVSDCLARHALPARIRPCLEITETAAITNIAQARRFVTELKKLGCLVCLDDFGTGMSSFSYLKDLPVDYLKIDGSFVKDMKESVVDYAIVEAIHRVGRTMGIQTVAEYVRDQSTLEQLRAMGIDYGQGFHLAEPLSLEVYWQKLGERGIVHTMSAVAAPS
jgi:diguanylate cyclase (GGDEF)-like protein/PAS domain S-box-containing protein